MPLATCIFAARFPDRPPADLARRVERIRSFYEPVGLGHVAVVNPADNLVVGLLSGEEQPLSAESGVLVWGERLPDDVDPLSAGPAELRAIDGMTGAFAWRDGRVAAVNAPAGPATLYRAGGAVSTHAVAAALLAGIRLELDRTAVAEFVAMDFAGGARTMLRDVAVAAPATRVTLTAEAEHAECYWPARERWQLVSERDAHDAAERELIESIGRRTRGERIGLALTAGLDSTVAAAALAEARVRPSAFTWGNRDWPDSAGAAATAQRFGFPHSVSGWEPLSSADCLTALDVEARWTDGIVALATARRSWPDDVDAIVVGMGGESGRAFYYDAGAAVFAPQPSSERLLIALGGDGRLRGADEEVRTALRDSQRGWIEDARAAGVTNWRVLDVLYAEQRVRRWGRSQLPRLDGDIVPLFTPARLARALVSLPLEQRLTDGFHRRFLATRGIEPATRPAELPRHSALGRLARRRFYALRGRPRAPYDDPVDSLVASVWAEKTDLADWLRTEALPHPAITESLGEAWGESTWEAFEAGRIRSTERLMRAAGAAAFATAIARI